MIFYKREIQVESDVVDREAKNQHRRTVRQPGRSRKLRMLHEIRQSRTACLDILMFAEIRVLTILYHVGVTNCYQRCQESWSLWGGSVKREALREAMRCRRGVPMNISLPREDIGRCF